jgi:predicted nucleic acid-binding protein
VRVALDTNILVYAEGAQRLPSDAGRIAAARALVARVPAEDLVLPVQVLGELYNVLTRRQGRPPLDASAAIEIWRTATIVQAITGDVLGATISLAGTHHLQIWDAIILAAAAEAGCGLLLSEDMQDGFAWRGTIVANPFAAMPHPLAAKLLG